MRAWHYTKYGGPNVLQFGHVAEPELIGPYDVIIRVHAAALNPIDYKRRAGTLKLVLTQQWPAIVGYDVSGVVASCGASVTKFRVGDAVYAMLPHNRTGAVAELAVAHELYFAKKPANLTHAEAASLPLCALTAVKAFRAGGLREGKKVLVTAGAGGVGSIALQIAKHMFRAGTVATTASGHKTERLQKLGADVVVDYKTKSFDRELANYDMALDASGEAKRCVECVARGGAVISIAEVPTAKSLEGLEGEGFNASWLVGTVLNCLIGSVARKARRADVTFETVMVIGDGAGLAEISALCEAKKIVPVVDRVFAFDQAAEAFAYLETGRADGKVIVQVVAE